MATNNKLTKLEQKTAELEASVDPFDSPPTRPMRIIAPGKAIVLAQPKKPDPELLEIDLDDIPEEPNIPEPTPPKPEPVTDIPTKAVVNWGEQSYNVTEARNEGGAPIYDANWIGRDVMVGMPVYRSVNPATMMAVLALALDFGKERIRFELEIGGALIADSRNNLAAKFLASSCPWLLMLDDDMIPAFGRAGLVRGLCRLPDTVTDEALNRHFLQRLLNSGQKLIGCAYFERRPGGTLAASAREYTQAAKQHTAQMVPVQWIGTGALLIHRDVFLAIQEKFPELQPTNGSPYPFFRRINEHGEDVSFCHRAVQAGHQPWMDMGSPVYHYGGFCYGGGTL